MTYLLALFAYLFFSVQTAKTVPDFKDCPEIWTPDIYAAASESTRVRTGFEIPYASEVEVDQHLIRVDYRTYKVHSWYEWGGYYGDWRVTMTHERCKWIPLEGSFAIN